MSFLSRSASRLVGYASKRSLVKNVGAIGVFAQSQCSVRPLTRSLVVLSTPSKINYNKHSMPSSLCACGCGINGMHTKGDRELVEFLQEEITAEKKTQTASVPSHIDDFTIKQDKAELSLTKNFNDEQITVSMNVNHTVGTDSSMEATQQEGGQEEEGALTSRPDFEVDVKVGSKVLSFTCQFTAPGDITEGDHVEDSFGISELTVYEGEWEEKTYCVSGEILDGVMYDLLMNYLEERGITNDFTEKLSNVCTSFEHNLYVNMLEKIQSFVKRK